jgi:23S rRNA (cytidine2498-2'-O)-methyltransferase
MPRHVFAHCQVGVERWLKAEVARTRPDLRPAFGRPGLVTWVAGGEVDADVALEAVFARVWGASLGRAPTGEAAAALLPDEPLHVHVWSREPDADRAALEVARARAELAATGRFAPEPRAAAGELVADVIVAPGEPWLVGLHRHGAGRWPAGPPEVAVPEEAPSRAFAKIEEAILWADLPVREGHVALEIGSAPGGAALALAHRGVTVWGADPAEMSKAVTEYRHLNGARVHHLPVKVGALRWEDLPEKIDWLLLDVHLAPQVALHAIQRFMPRLRPKLRGAVLTLKLNDDHVVAEIPALLDRVLALGFEEVRATQLPSNRREICVVAR